MKALDPAVVSASVPFAAIPSTEAMIAAIRAPNAHPAWRPHLERLLLELTPQVALEFSYRHGITMAELQRAYAVISAAAGLRNPELEDALDGVA